MVRAAAVLSEITGSEPVAGLARQLREQRLQGEAPQARMPEQKVE
ncbi:MAG: hypothetical protein ACK6A4_03800 [Alphaproteobacteria bacterium]